jgi:hypothetical protein
MREKNETVPGRLVSYSFQQQSSIISMLLNPHQITNEVANYDTQNDGMTCIVHVAVRGRA